MAYDSRFKRLRVLAVMVAVLSIASIWSQVLPLTGEAEAAGTGDLVLSYSDGEEHLWWESLVPKTVNATANNSIVLTNSNPSRHYSVFNMTINDLQGDPNNLPMADNYFVDVYEDETYVGRFKAVGRYVNFSASLTSANSLKIVPTIRWVYEFCIGDFAGTFSITAFNDTATQSTGAASLSVESAPAILMSYDGGQTKLTYGTHMNTETYVWSIYMLITITGNDELSHLEFLVEDMTNDSNVIETFKNMEIQYILDVSHGGSWWYWQEPLNISMVYNLQPGNTVKVRFLLYTFNVNNGVYGGMFTVRGYTPAGLGTNTETGYQEITVDSTNVVMEMNYSSMPHPLQVLFGEEGISSPGGGIVRYDGGFTEIEGGDEYHVLDISWHPSGRYAVGVGGYGPLKSYDGTKITTYSMPGNYYRYGVDWRPDGSYALIVGQSGTVLKYDGSSFTSLTTGTTDSFTSVAWHPDGNIAFLGTSTGKVVNYDAASESFSTIYTGGEFVFDIGWKPDGSMCLIVGQYGFVLKYNTTGFTTLNSGVNFGHYGIDWKPDGSYAVIGTNGYVIKYDGAAFSRLHTNVNEHYKDVSFNPNGSSAFIVEENGKIYEYNETSVNLVYTHTWGLKCAEYSPTPLYDTSVRFSSVTPGNTNINAENWFVIKNVGSADIDEFSMYFMDLNFTGPDGTHYLAIGGNAKIVCENGTEYPIPGNGYANFTLTLKPGEDIGYNLIITNIPSNQRAGTYTGIYTITGTHYSGTKAYLSPSLDRDTLIGTIGTPPWYPWPLPYPYPYPIPGPGSINVQYSDGASRLTFKSPLEAGKEAENILVISNDNLYPVSNFRFTFQNMPFKVYAKDQNNRIYHPDTLGTIRVNRQLGVGHTLIMRFFIESVTGSYSQYLDYPASYTIKADSNPFIYRRYPYLDIPIEWQPIYPIEPIFIRDTIVSHQSLRVEKDLFKWSLRPGWNLISKPFIEGNTQRASDVAGIKGVTQVARYNPEGKEFEFYIKNVPAQSIDFDIENDVGYWVFAEENSTSIVTGSVPSQRQVNLSKGWNLLGWTSVYRLKASQLAFLDDNTSQLISYNDQKQYEYYLTGLPSQSTDFVIDVGKGYWIHTKEETTLIYGG